MNAQDTNPVITPEVHVSQLALEALESSGETLEEVLKSHLPWRYPHDYFSMQAHELHSGVVLLLGFEPRDNTVGVLVHSEFMAEMLKEQVP